MKKEFILTIFYLFIICFAKESYAGFSTLEEATIKKTIVALQAAKGQDFEKVRLNRISSAEIYIQDFDLKKPADIEHLKVVKQNIILAKKNYMNRTQSEKYIDKALSHMMQIEGGEIKQETITHDYNADNAARIKKHKPLHEAFDDLGIASRATDKKVIAEQIKLVQEKIYPYKGKTDGKVEEALDYLDKAMELLEEPAPYKKARNYMGRARGRISFALSYLEKQKN